MVRLIIVAVLGLALAASSAMAQGRKGLGSGMGKYEPPPEDKPLFTEQGYKAASDRIPTARQSNDPWAGAREPSSDPSATSSAAKTRKKP